MSIIVKGMEMPKNCGECSFLQESFWRGKMFPCVCIAGGFVIKPSETDLKDGLCPLVELPEKHGDLIDRQKLLDDNKHLEYPTDGKYRSDRAWAVGFNAGARHCNEHTIYAPTVIEAEDEE